VLLICSPVGLHLLTRFGAVVALLFSQYNVAWRSFVWAWGSGCWRFAYGFCW
jgi:hypothetical protein